MGFCHWKVLDFNNKVWDLSSILEVGDSSVGFIRPLALQLQQLTFVVWFFHSSFLWTDIISERFTILLACYVWLGLTKGLHSGVGC